MLNAYRGSPGLFVIDDGPVTFIILFVGAPPPAIVATLVSTAPNPASDGLVAYWNVLLDGNQNGAWDSPREWVVQDRPVFLVPGTTTLAIAPAFQWPTSGGGFGRLIFPVWVRSMISQPKVETNVDLQGVVPQYWDGRGMAGGFTAGDVEDHFVEWRPIGPMYPGRSDEHEALAPSLDELPEIDCATHAVGGQETACALSGPAIASLWVVCTLAVGGEGERSQFVRLDTEGTAALEGDFALTATRSAGKLVIDVGAVTKPSRLLVFAEPAALVRSRGEGAVRLAAGAEIEIR